MMGTVLAVCPQIDDEVEVTAEDYAGMTGTITRIVRDEAQGVFKFKVRQYGGVIEAYFTADEFDVIRHRREVN